MTIRKNRITAAVGGLAALLLLTATASAQDKVSPEDTEAVTQGNANRFSLVAVDDDILRVDRQNGTVSICKEQNDAWRCSPVPLVEDAYLAEINDLAEDVDRLTARLEDLEGRAGDGNKEGEQSPPASALDGDGKGDTDKPSSLSRKDEEELDKVLDFTESAMRRFFGMVRDLQKDLEGEQN